MYLASFSCGATLFAPRRDAYLQSIWDKTTLQRLGSAVSLHLSALCRCRSNPISRHFLRSVARVRIRLPYTDLVNEMHLGKIRGGIPIIERRWVESGRELSTVAAALYAGRSLVLSSWYRYCGTYNSPTDNTQA